MRPQDIKISRIPNTDPPRYCIAMAMDAQVFRRIMQVTSIVNWEENPWAEAFHESMESFIRNSSTSVPRPENFDPWWDSGLIYINPAARELDI